MELHGKPIKVTVIYPGYIASEMNEGVAAEQPLMVSTEKGVRAIVAAIEKEKASACVPPAPVGADVGGDEARPAAGLQAAHLRSPRCG